MTTLPFPILGQTLQTRGVTSPYGWRVHPTTGARSMHSGVDIAAKPSDVYIAMFAGTANVRRDPINGILVRVTSVNGALETAYAHCSAVSVSSGDLVDAGQPVATAGTTGRSTGYHLHLQIRVMGETVDPMLILEDRPGVLSRAAQFLRSPLSREEGPAPFDLDAASFQTALESHPDAGILGFWSPGSALGPDVLDVQRHSFSSEIVMSLRLVSRDGSSPLQGLPTAVKIGTSSSRWFPRGSEVPAKQRTWFESEAWEAAGEFGQPVLDRWSQHLHAYDRNLWMKSSTLVTYHTVVASDPIAGLSSRIVLDHGTRRWEHSAYRVDSLPDREGLGLPRFSSDGGLVRIPLLD